MLPRAAAGGLSGLCMNAGTGKIKVIAPFRSAGKRAGLPPQGADPSSIDLDLVNGVKNSRDTVGGVDTTYAKPVSSFFASAGEKHRCRIVLQMCRGDPLVHLCFEVD